MNWHEHYDYGDGKLYRKYKNHNHTEGKQCGYVDLRGYVRTKLFSKMTFAHRVIWEMHNGEIPKGMEIDHINGVKHDNRIENLRCVDRWINCKNASMRSDNKSGQTGVSFSKAKNLWMVRIQVNKFTYSLDTPCKEEAVKYAKSVYAANPEFTERHGK